MARVLPDLQTRSLADVVTSDNPGILPPAISRELIGAMDAGRPFLASTRRLPTPARGMTLQVPTLDRRPTTGPQAQEKDQPHTQHPEISSTAFDAVTIAGGGDLSLQILKRSDPDYLSLYLALLGAAYAAEADAQAITTLLADPDVVDGGVLDATAFTVSDAWVAAEASSAGAPNVPNTLWLSMAGIAAFTDATGPGGDPLYPKGTSAPISALNPIHVPALDDAGIAAIVGQSQAFAWAEDGTYTLAVDVPSKAGQDVAIVGMVWLAPWYPGAFTVYAVES